MSDEQTNPLLDSNGADPAESNHADDVSGIEQADILSDDEMSNDAPPAGDAPKRPRPGIPAWTIGILIIALTGVLIWAGDAYLRARQQRHEQADLPAPTATLAQPPTLAQVATVAPTATPPPQATATRSAPTAIPPAPDADETLILVADLGGASAQADQDAAESIYEALVAQADEHGTANVRIERLQQVVDESEAQSLGQEHQAAYVLWGTQDGQDILVHLTHIGTAQHRSTDTPQDLILSEPDETDLCRLGDGFSAAPSPLARFVLGVAAYRQGENTAGSAYLDEVIDLGKDATCPTALAHAYLYAGNLQAIEGEYAGALESYDAVLELAPNTPAAYANRGSVHYVMDNHASALDDLNRALDLDPQHANAYYYRANVHRAAGETEAALVDLDRALEANPRHVRAYTSRGLLRHNMGDYTAALDDYNRALQLDPGAAEVYLNRGGTHATLGNFEAALDDYARALELNPDDVDAYYNRGTVYAMMEAYELALADLDHALELAPEFAQVYGNRGLVYKAMGETEKAIADLERFLELSDNPQWRQMIGQHLAELKGQ